MHIKNRRNTYLKLITSQLLHLTIFYALEFIYIYCIYCGKNTYGVLLLFVSSQFHIVISPWC